MRVRLLVAVCLLAISLQNGCAPGPSAPPPPADPSVQLGAEVFQEHCAACHATGGDTVIVGPTLAEIAGRAGDRVPGLNARQYLELAILKPDTFLVPGFEDVMPADLGKKMTGDEFDALVDYLLTLH